MIQHIISANCEKSKCVPDAILKRGHYLRSSNGKYLVHLRQNGDLELTAGKTVIWTTGTNNVGVDFLYFDWDGPTLRGTDNKTIWKANKKSDEWCHKLQIQENGDLVVKNKCNEIIWATNTYEGTI